MAQTEAQQAPDRSEAFVLGVCHLCTFRNQVTAIHRQALFGNQAIECDQAGHAALALLGAGQITFELAVTARDGLQVFFRVTLDAHNVGHRQTHAGAIDTYHQDKLGRSHAGATQQTGQ